MRQVTKVATVLAGTASMVANQASAQAIGVEVRNGDVYVQQQQGWGRLTRDGRSTAVVKSRDGRLIAYVRKEGGEGDDEMDSISLCVVAEKTCHVIVSPKSSDLPEENLTSANSPAFSYQAGVEPSGALVGSLYFQTSAYMNMGAVHRLTLNDGKISFIVPAVSYTVLQSGKFTGALDIVSFVHGECKSETIDPNTKKILQTKDLPC